MIRSSVQIVITEIKVNRIIYLYDLPVPLNHLGTFFELEELAVVGAFVATFGAVEVVGVSTVVVVFVTDELGVKSTTGLVVNLVSHSSGLIFTSVNVV